MGKKKSNAGSADQDGSGSGLPQEEKTVKYITPAFIYNGKTYQSAEEEELVAAGDHDAQMRAIDLMKVGQVVEIKNEEE